MIADNNVKSILHYYRGVVQMEKLFNALGFKKSDEMEKDIHLKAIQLTWLYTIVFLISWCLYESYTARINGENPNLIPLTLLVSQNFVLFFTQLFFRARMTSGGGEEKESLPGKVAPIAALVSIVAVLLVVITHFIMR